MRSSKSIATVLGAAGVAGACALVLTAAGAYAIIDPSAPSPSSSEAIGTAPHELTGTPPAADATSNDATALTAAVRAPVPPAAIEWAEAGGQAASTWAQPRLKGMTRFAGRYEPRFDMHFERKGYGDEAQLQFALGRDETKVPTRTQVNRLGFMAGTTPPAARQKGHFFLFAAGGSNAVGLNMLRDPSGEIRRAGWSSEHIAAVGSGQVGIGWRKGPLQASFGVVERELSAYGRSVNQKFLAFTISLSPTGPRVGGGGGARPWVERDDPHYHGRH